MTVPPKRLVIPENFNEIKEDQNEMDSPTFPKYQTDYLNFLVNNLEQASDEKKKTENKY